MPAPWQAAAEPVIVPDVSKRGITVEQLSDLRTFLQRLCKAGLLKNTSERSKSLGTYGQSIDWCSINMYQITAEVIKKAIPYVDKRCDRDPNRKWYSWTEFLGKGPQEPKLMMSHSWSGHFRDFMAVVDQLSEGKSLSVHTAIWICTFANCPFGEPCGSQIEDYPCLRVLRNVDLTVMVVDRKVDVLTRSWCGLELYYTVAKENDLELYTSLGKVGSERASSGAFVEAVKRWDIRRTEATEGSYRRQVFNYIAGAPETKGLQTDPDGQFKLEAGRPQLEDSACDDGDGAHRRTGSKEYAYEAALFREHADRFEEFNMAVRLEIMAKIGRPRKAKGCDVGLAERGVTLGQIRAFAKKVAAECESWGAGHTWKDVNVYVINDHLVKPITAEAKCSYMELVSDGPQLPRYHIDHAWIDPFCQTISSIEWFAQAMQLSDHTVFFLDMLAHRGHTNMYSSLQGDLLQYPFAGAVRECQGSVHCFTANVDSLRRAWRAITLELVSYFGKDCYLTCPGGAIACTKPFPDGNRVWGSFCPHIALLLSKVRIEDCEGHQKFDAEVIMRFFLGGANGSLEQQRRCDRFNARLRRATAGVLVRDAAQTGDVERLREVCTTAGLSINSDSMRGGLRETALHLAASAGDGALDTLKELLRLGMDPNSENVLMERPLHWAALSGNAEAARELISAKADVLCESIFGETPLAVAQQSPAAFLGIECEEVVKVLMDAEQPLR